MTVKSLAFAPPGRALAVLVLLSSQSLGATSLEVQPVDNGTLFGARIDLENTCEFEIHGLLTGPLPPGAYGACSSLTSDADLSSGDTMFTAGDRVILTDGFSVGLATMIIQIDRELYPDAWVQDDTPDGETVYAARFFVNPSGLVMGEADRFYQFLAFDGQGNPELRVGVKFNSGLLERRLFLEVFTDNGGLASTESNGEELELPTGWQWVEVGWQSSPGPGLNTGQAHLCVGSETSCASLSSLDNDTGAIDFVRWGAVDVPSDSDLGVLDLDDFESGPFSDNFESGNTDAWSHTSEEAAGAQTCNVPLPYKTVHAAVADPDCTTVLIAAGTHLGSVTVARTLTLQGAGQGSTVLGGALKVRGQSTELTLSSLSIDTTGALAGCYPVVFEVSDGAVVYPEAITVSNAAGVPTGRCHVFSDSYESVD